MDGPPGTPDERLQDGIYYRPGERPACYRLLLLDVVPGAPPARTRDALSSVWTMLGDLRLGLTRDLAPRPGEPAVGVPPDGLTCLLAFGARLFDGGAHAPTPVSPDLRPPGLRPLPSAGSPFPKLPWAEDRGAGEADLAIQFIAGTESAVNLAVVETWKLIADEGLPLEPVAFHSGFGRGDGRSWIDFHDGLNNMAPGEERRKAIETVIADPPWMEGGTYMCFMKLVVDLDVWRGLTRDQQEVLVGRDKLTGCPLQGVEEGRTGRPVPVVAAGCPVPGKPRPEDRDPPQPGNRLLQASHIHRSNHNRGFPDTDANNRIYRQGYEFLDTLDGGKPVLGLHFVSFQRDPAILRNVLGVPEWLGDVNFGGPKDTGSGEPPPVDIISVVAGGFYAVPPREDPFPGAGIFVS